MTSSRVDLRRGPTRARAAAVPAPALVLVAIASVQTGSAVAKTLFHQLHPGGTTLLRVGIAAVVLLAAVRPRSLPRRDHLPDLVVFGVVLAAMNLAFYSAINRIPLGPAVTIEFCGPLAVAVAGSRRLLDALWVVLAATGVVLLTWSGSGLRASGVLLALLAGTCWAAYIVVNQRVGAQGPGLSGLAVAMAIGTVVLVPFGVPAGLALFRPRLLAGGAAVAVLSSVIPYSLELAALRRLPQYVFGVLMSLEPAMAALAGWIVLGEHLRERQLVAIAAVMTASAGATLSRRRGPPPEA